MLINIPPRRILGRFIPVPLPPARTFDGKTVLIIGGTTGLGLAAAVHFARLGASVIITGRTESRAESAKRHIQESLGIDQEIKCMTLDLSIYESCTAFVGELKKCLPGPEALDVAVLNAGLINTHHEESPEGWEQTIQVNSLSTALLGLLLLAWMQEGRNNRSQPAHLVFITSRDHLYPDFRQWSKWAKEEGGILRHLSDKKNWPAWWKTTEPNYGNSKLLIMYAVAEIAELARGPNGEPRVIVNSTCPGVVRTDIGRTIAQSSWFMRFAVPAYLRVLGKSTDYGARFYVRAALKPIESHGEFSNGWLTARQYQKLARPAMTSPEGREVQALVWQEIVTELGAKVDGVRELLHKNDST
ncbi:hypothetical protein F4861DRAFT_494685 [Xylaria intraflava]|nr:hypothetical protein F4861DRAFT_494685 [Xylaria intraflava]